MPIRSRNCSVCAITASRSPWSCSWSPWTPTASTPRLETSHTRATSPATVTATSTASSPRRNRGACGGGRARARLRSVSLSDQLRSHRLTPDSTSAAAGTATSTNPLPGFLVPTSQARKGHAGRRRPSAAARRRTSPRRARTGRRPVRRRRALDTGLGCVLGAAGVGLRGGLGAVRVHVHRPVLAVLRRPAVGRLVARVADRRGWSVRIIPKWASYSPVSGERDTTVKPPSTTYG